MKKINLIALTFTCCAVMFIVSCKKRDQSNAAVIAEEITESKMHNDDNANVDGETEQIEDDVNNTVASCEKFSGTANTYGAGLGPIPFDLDTTNPANTARKLILTFNGRGMPGTCKKRTGTITIELLNQPRWIEPGAVLKYTFVNFKVLDSCRNRSVTINGERFVTNVNGGNMFKLKRGLVQSLVHRVRTGASGITAVFQDSLNNTRTAVWNITKLHTITANNSAGLASINLKTQGDSTVNGVANTSSWGTTRNSKSYQSSISTPIKSNSVCRFWRPTEGVVNHSILGGISTTTTFGLDAMGNAVTSGCATHFKINYTLSNSNTGNALVPYR